MKPRTARILAAVVVYAATAATTTETLPKPDESTWLGEKINDLREWLGHYWPWMLTNYEDASIGAEG